MWGDVIRYAEVTSTCDLARDHARRGAGEGTAVVAGYQAAGRGRQGRTWTAPPGSSLLVSVILSPPPALAHSAWLTLAAGVAVAETIKAVCELSPRLKWPNDVRLRGQKVAGILAESFRLDGVPQAVIGVGINLRQTAEDLAELPEATSLALVAEGSAWTPDDLLGPLLTRLRERYEELPRGDFAAARAHWEAFDETVGRSVTVEGAGAVWHGRATRVDEYGALWVEDQAGELRCVTAGDVSIRFDC